jgi:hypothetical protein
MESVFKYDIIIIIIDNYLLYLNKDLNNIRMVK